MSSMKKCMGSNHKENISFCPCIIISDLAPIWASQVRPALGVVCEGESSVSKTIARQVAKVEPVCARVHVCACVCV